MVYLMKLLAWIKLNSKLVAFWFLSFILPIRPLLIIVGLSIVVDTIFGIMAAKKSGKKITSGRLSDVIGKILVYNIAIISFYYLEIHLLGEFISMIFPNIELLLTKVLAIVLTSIELFSIDEKFKVITGTGIFERLMKLIKGYKSFKRKVEE